jgi:nitrogen permease regulator 3-like protein
VLDPPTLEYSLRLKEIYENVIKKFSKALKWEQARADYVWNEAQNILQIKEKAREKSESIRVRFELRVLLTVLLEASMNSLYSELIARSSLARAISTVFTSISTSKIASVSLGPDASISLQIPPPTSTPYLPSSTDAAYPGLWLTTADEPSPADDAVTGGIDPHSETLAKHFALLLLDNEAAILKDVEASGGALGPALAHYIRTTKPNKSFMQISAISGIPLSHIQLLASHLVYWRRARAIPPLHQRDTYIVSPNCDLSKLPAATAAYAATFPTLPSLPKMLSALSGTPRPYATFIPSKDHKAAYFSILAWLLRGGWVTQLRAFARIKVPPEIKIAVDRTLQQEEMGKLISENRAFPNSPTNRQGADVRDDNSSPSSLGSHGSDQDTIIPGQRESLSQYHLSNSRNAHLRTSSLILFPHRASPIESRWLDEIMARFPDPPPESVKGITSMGDGHEAEPGIHDSLKGYWPKFTKYFNGHDALEKIAAREGLKRKVVWQLLMRMGMITGQNLGIELDPKEQILIAVRHW